MEVENERSRMLREAWNAKLENGCRKFRLDYKNKSRKQKVDKFTKIQIERRENFFSHLWRIWKERR